MDQDAEIELYQDQAPPLNRQTNFGPVNLCMYCGSTARPLTDEHAIPFGLNGTFVIQKASCTECAKLTHAFEGHVLGRMYSSFRFAQMARSRSGRAKLKPIWAEYADRCDLVEVTPLEHPGFLPIVHLHSLPGLVTWRPPAWSFESLTLSLRRTERWRDVVRWHDDGTIELTSFCRMIAKIAHCVAFIRCGPGGFEPIVPSYLRRDSKIFEIVGGSTTEQQHGDPVHAFDLSIMNVGPLSYLVAKVTLFADWRTINGLMPTYMVLVGVVNDKTPQAILPPEAYPGWSR